MLNILLGIGIGGLGAMATRANRKHQKHPDRPIKYKPYEIQISPTLLVSAGALLLTLLALLVFVSRNKWVFSRKLGIGLIIIWSISIVCNLAIEGTGVWSSIS
jgi:solute carrier family 24 (sodium/potassium/calcium exchanger), member 6